MILLAVDPSIRSCGVALFAGDVLVACAKLRGEVLGLSIAERCRDMALRVQEWTTVHLNRRSFDRLAVEWPQAYRPGKSKGDSNDLFGLAGICAAVAALYPGAEVASYLPDDWQPAPKVSPERKRRGLGPIDSEAFTSPRGKRVLSRLSDTERLLVPMSHDAVDAVGIGLYNLGRLAPRKIYPGATPG